MRQVQTKFTDPLITLKGEKRAWVSLNKLKTLWFNTGTLCNLSCENCYIESNPKNDSLVYLTTDDIRPYLDEIRELHLETQEIAFTGGEPFLNPNMLDLIELSLNYGHRVLVLTNAYRVITQSKKQKLKELSIKFPQKLVLRVSLDHYSKEIHERERGLKTFGPTLSTMAELSEMGVSLAIAGRSLVNEPLEVVKRLYQKLMNDWKINLDFDSPDIFIIFPEMILDKDVPEITTNCWEILSKDPTSIMCSNSRMIVKRKGDEKTKVLSCTLLAYDRQFELGTTLKDSKKDVFLNHSFCAQFCVLGGASCSV